MPGFSVYFTWLYSQCHDSQPIIGVKQMLVEKEERAGNGRKEEGREREVRLLDQLS